MKKQIIFALVATLFLGANAMAQGGIQGVWEGTVKATDGSYEIPAKAILFQGGEVLIGTFQAWNNETLITKGFYSKLQNKFILGTDYDRNTWMKQIELKLEGDTLNGFHVSKGKHIATISLKRSANAVIDNLETEPYEGIWKGKLWETLEDGTPNEYSIREIGYRLHALEGGLVVALDDKSSQFVMFGYLTDDGFLQFDQVRAIEIISTPYMLKLSEDGQKLSGQTYRLYHGYSYLELEKQ